MPIKSFRPSEHQRRLSASLIRRLSPVYKWNLMRRWASGRLDTDSAAFWRRDAEMLPDLRRGTADTG